MHGNVFIGWSSSNDLAKKVKKELSSHGYSCIVGGSDGLTGSLSIADTIASQIASSCQSMFIIRKNNLGYISNNVTFEIGYSVSKYNSTLQKLHLFYLDIDPKDDSIPSDLLGLWATHIVTEGKTDDEVVGEIVRSFLDHQKTELVENKMDLMTNWMKLYMILSNNLDAPNHSDFDIAQYMLFFLEATANAHTWNEARPLIKRYEQTVGEESTELYYMIRLYQTSDEMLAARKNNGLRIYLPKQEFRLFRGRLKSLIERMAEYSSPECTTYNADLVYTKWFTMFCKQRLQFAYMLQSNDPELEDKDSVLKKAETLNRDVLELCQELRDMDPAKNKEALWGIEFMTHRNLALIAQHFNDPETEKKEFIESFRSTREIHNKYDGKIDTRIAETFEREYYMAVMDTIRFMDEDDAEESIEELEDYVDRMLRLRDSNTIYINRIKEFLQGNEIKGL